MKADCNNGDYYEVTIVDKSTGEETKFVMTSNKNDYEVLSQHYDNVQLIGQDGNASNSNNTSSSADSNN